MVDLRLRMIAPGTLVALAITALTGCGRAESPRPAGSAQGAGRTEARDVVLVTIDTLRYDATGFSGAGRVETPVMDAVAAAGAVFRFAHAHAVLTLPSHASILTGLYPYQHGLHDNAGFVLGDDVTTLPGLLARAGYRTGAFVSAFPLDRRFGLDSGFETYDDETEGRSHGAGIAFAERPGEETVARAKAWWDGHRGSRRFLWVHLFSPHAPYTPSGRFAETYRDAPYYGEAALADAQLAPLLRPFLDGTEGPAAIVLTSDHGEGLGDHGEQTHGLFAYEATLRVPLVVWAPGLVDATQDDAPARHVDIVPTILDIVGVAAPAGLPGRSLVRPAPSTGETGSYFESLEAYLNRGWAPLRGRLEGKRKAIDLPIPELYDLDADPGETINLADRDPAAHQAMVQAIPAAAREPIERQPLDPETIATLRSLGYIAGNASLTPGNASDPALDPKRLFEVDRALDDATHRYAEGDAIGATRILRGVIASHPRIAVAYSHLSEVLFLTGHPDEAASVLSRAVALGIARESMRTRLALLLAESGKTREAASVLAGMSESKDPETQAAFAQIAMAEGRMDEARTRLERSLALDPTSSATLTDLGAVLLSQGKTSEAKPYLERAVAQNPAAANAWNGLGVIRAGQGDRPGAIDAWQRACRADPTLSDAWFNLGMALRAVGNGPAAIQALERYAALVAGNERNEALAAIEQIRRAGR